MHPNLLFGELLGDCRHNMPTLTEVIREGLRPHLILAKVWLLLASLGGIWSPGPDPGRMLVNLLWNLPTTLEGFHLYIRCSVENNSSLTVTPWPLPPPSSPSSNSSL